MEKFKYVFSVVVYRNYNDLIELLKSIRKKIYDTYKIIIVNNYYNEESEQIIKNIALEYNCDYISSPNNGYGAGNNLAINYALKNYMFQYLIISNPDIIIKKFNDTKISELGDIIAPEITTINEKKQNPMSVFDFKIANFMIYKGLKNNNRFLFFIGLALNKLIREAARLVYKFFPAEYHKIYMVHGSFFLVSYKVLKLINPLYDEKIFLFGEENYLAIKFKKSGIKSWYTNKISVLHKEDGSMKFRDDIHKQLRNSNIYVYEKYYKKH